MTGLRRFTLIELLVVIAIIAILASILLPTLQRAKSTAHSALCTNNTKQIVMACQMYSDDYEDCIPDIREDSSTNNAHWWDLVGVVTGQYRSMALHDIGYIEWKRGHYTEGIFKCPAAEAIDPKWTTVDRFDAHYGMNSNMIGPAVGAFYSLKNFPQPSDTIYLGDGKILNPADWGGTFHYYFVSSISGGNSHVDPGALPYIWKHPEFSCHNDRVNLAFLDLHVESFARSSPPVQRDHPKWTPGNLAGDQWRYQWTNWGPY